MSRQAGRRAVRAQILEGEDVSRWRDTIKSDAKKGWQRAVATQKAPATRESLDGESADLDTPTLTPRSPAETMEAARAHLFGHIFANRENLQLMVRKLRESGMPGMGHLTDDQAARLLRQEYERRLRQATAEAFRRAGRGQELVIKTKGF